MKTQSPRIINDPEKKTPEAVLNHIQAVTNDVRNILNGGLSFADGQLPFQYREINVTSGQFNILMIQSPYTTIGIIPVQTYGVNILSWSVNIISGKVGITVNLENTNTAKIGFLMIGASR